MNKLKKVITVATALVMTASVGALSACGGDGYGSSASNEAAEKITAKFASQNSKSVSVNGSVNLGGNSFSFTADANYGTGDMDIALTLNNGYSYMFLRDWDAYSVDSATKITDFSTVTLVHLEDLKASLEEELGEAAAEILAQAPAVINHALSTFNTLSISFAKAANAVSYKNNTLTVDYNLALYNYAKDMNSVVSGLKTTTTLGELLTNSTVKKYMQVFTELVTIEELNTAVDLINSFISMPEYPDEYPDEYPGEYPGEYPDEDDNYNEDDYYFEDDNYNEDDDNFGYGYDDGSDGDFSYDFDYGYPEYPEESVSVLGVIGGMVTVLDELMEQVQPDANSSTYDYLVKLISSDELKDLINESAGAEVFTKKVTELTVGEMIALLTETSDEAQITATLGAIKEMYASSIETITAKDFSFGMGKLTGVVFTYTVDSEYALLSQTMAASMSTATSTTGFELEIKYSNNAVTLITLA